MKRPLALFDGAAFFAEQEAARERFLPLPK
jgi:hypothetical protein